MRLPEKQWAGPHMPERKRDALLVAYSNTVWATGEARRDGNLWLARELAADAREIAAAFGTPVKRRPAT